MKGSWPAKIKNVAWLKVLHADWLGNPLIKSRANLQTGLLLKNRSQSVEVPIVVIPERPGCVTSSGGTVFGHGLRFKINQVVHT